MYPDNRQKDSVLSVRTWMSTRNVEQDNLATGTWASYLKSVESRTEQVDKQSTGSACACGRHHEETLIKPQGTREASSTQRVCRQDGSPAHLCMSLAGGFFSSYAVFRMLNGGSAVPIIACGRPMAGVVLVPCQGTAVFLAFQTLVKLRSI